MTMISLSFADTYGGPKFPLVKFFPGAKKTTSFGIDRTFENLRIHNAIDRAGGPMVFVPFDAEEVELITEDLRYRDSFGTITRLITLGGDFEVRIAHLELADMTTEFIDAIGQNYIPAGTPIGPAGNAGRSTNPHTHTEIVSLGETSKMLDGLLEDHNEMTVTPHVVKNIAEVFGLSPEEAIKDYADQVEGKKVKRLTNLRCERVDYLDGRPKTFYSSWAAFNGM